MNITIETPAGPETIERRRMRYDRGYWAIPVEDVDTVDDVDVWMVPRSRVYQVESKGGYAAEAREFDGTGAFVYETPDGAASVDLTDVTLDYVDDHWRVPIDGDRDVTRSDVTVRRIPDERVYRAAVRRPPAVFRG